MVGLKMFPDIKREFFETGFHSSRVSGESLKKTYIDMGYSEENAFGGYYYIAIPWKFLTIGGFVAFLISIAAFCFVQVKCVGGRSSSQT